MPNGSLGDILHSTKGGTLDWGMRLRIALGTAQVLDKLTGWLLFVMLDVLTSWSHEDWQVLWLISVNV